MWIILTTLTYYYYYFIEFALKEPPNTSHCVDFSFSKSFKTNTKSERMKPNIKRLSSKDHTLQYANMFPSDKSV